MRSTCVHCGALNIEFATFCARCERPLKKAAGAAQVTQKPTTQPGSAAPSSPPPRRRKMPPPPPSAPVTPTPMEEALHGAHVPQKGKGKPVLEVSLEAARSKFTADVAPSRGTGPDSVDETPSASVSFPAAPEPPSTTDIVPAPMPLAVPKVAPPLKLTFASGWRVGVAMLLDALVAVAVGIGFARLEVFLFYPALDTRGVVLLDRAADWIDQYSSPALHGLLVAVFLSSLVNFETTRRTGQTLGRWLTRTWLVRPSGRPLAAWVLALRTALSWVSLLGFGAGYWWCLTDRHARTLHDKVLGTSLAQASVEEAP